MRIVIDMQGAQTGSRLRGIGRYTLSLTKAIVRNKDRHEILLALNGAFQDSIQDLMEEFTDLIPANDIHVWSAPSPTSWNDPANNQRMEIAQKIREAFLKSLAPDVIIVTSMFEGWSSNAVSSVGVFDRDTPVVGILYDLIPLTHPDDDFNSSLFQKGYKKKIQYLTKCRSLLAISEYTRQEGIRIPLLPPDDIVNISGACDSSFKSFDFTQEEIDSCKEKFGIEKPFVMYAGGADHRKNLVRLIKAYSMMSDGMPYEHQLVFVGDMPNDRIDALRTVAKTGNLTEKDFLFTGYVNDRELVLLYNSCTVFVFPSLQEGFGLPALEAMACGTAVITSNATSLPEIVGWNQAMFDPYSVRDIKDKLERVFTEPDFRNSLIEHGLERAKQFSWDKTALRAIKELERVAGERVCLSGEMGEFQVINIKHFQQKQMKILILKLDHIGDLLLAIPAISKLKARYPYADIDIVVGAWNKQVASATGFFNKIYTFDYFKDKSSSTERATRENVDKFISQLEWYDLAIDLRRHPETRFILAAVNARLKVGYESFDQQVDSMLDITLTSHRDASFVATPMDGIHISKQMLNLIDSLPCDINDYVLLPTLGKRQRPLLNSIALFPYAGNDGREWEQSKYEVLAEKLLTKGIVKQVNVYCSKAESKRSVIFEENEAITIHSGLSFPDLVYSLSENVLCVANNSAGVHLSSYLGLVVFGLYSGQDTIAQWGPPFGNSYIITRNAFCTPCHIMRRDCPNDYFCMAELSVDMVLQKIEQMLEYLRDRKNISTDFSGRAPCASNDKIVDHLISAIAKEVKGTLSDEMLLEAAKCIHGNMLQVHAQRQLFVNITELVRYDGKSGIQRVTRNILRELLQNQSLGYSVIPVYFDYALRYYRRASTFLNSFFSRNPQVSDDSLISPNSGDLFLCLDSSLEHTEIYNPVLQKMRQDGVVLKYVIYDLFCLTMPENFMDWVPPLFQKYIEIVAQSDGVVCISKTVADQMKQWMDENHGDRLSKFTIDWFHLGAELDRNNNSTGLPDGFDESLRKISSAPSFLIVSTLEPRKGHAQVLSAFERLWSLSVDVNLVFVGSKGWKTEKLVDALTVHPRLNQRLFWFENASDECLDKIYSTCSCMIAASKDEGFGLFLVEAARHKIPIIARDIPVFKEIAQQNAYYFSGDSSDVLAESIVSWLKLYESGIHPRSDDLPWLSWQRSAECLLDALLLPSSSQW